MPAFFDLFTGNTRSNAQGVATPDLPSDGAKQTDIGRILEGIADASETGAQFVNSFKSGSDGGRAVSKPVQVSQDARPLFGLPPLALLAIVAVAGFALWRLFRR